MKQNGRMKGKTEKFGFGTAQTSCIEVEDVFVNL